MQKGPKSLVTYLLVLLCISYTNTLQWFASESKRTCLTAETWSHVHTPHAREAGIKLALQWTQTCMAMTFIQPWDWILAHGPFLSHWFHFNSILSYQNKELQVSSCFLVHVLFQKISLKKKFNPTHYSNLHHYKILLATFWSIDLPQAIPGEKAICLDMTTWTDTYLINVVTAVSISSVSIRAWTTLHPLSCFYTHVITETHSRSALWFHHLRSIQP